MNLSKYVEMWDTILFNSYNFLARILYFFKMLKVKSVIGKNKQYKNAYKGKRCFIVLNGPSLNNYDISKLKDEYVFCVNSMFNSQKVATLNPNFYCWNDTADLMSESAKDLIREIKAKCPAASLFVPYKSYRYIGKDERVFYTYSKHLTNKYNVKSNISGFSSNFATVAFYTLNIAIYMGFEEVYLLGLDFEPGAFKHFENLGSECQDPNAEIEKYTVCGNYWGYVKSQYDSYSIAKHAKKKGIKVYNCNFNSCIRAFDFKKYTSIF